jgi:hypothetical protein
MPDAMQQNLVSFNFLAFLFCVLSKSTESMYNFISVFRGMSVLPLGRLQKLKHCQNAALDDITAL